MLRSRWRVGSCDTSRAVVGIDVIEMIHGRHHRAVSGIVASQLVGHQPAGLLALAFE